MTHSRRCVLTLAVAALMAVAPLAAGIKVNVQVDKQFDYAGLKTYKWRLDGPNPIRILENSLDNPDQIRKNLEPILLATVDEALGKKGFRRIETGEPDLYLDYYALIGPNTQSQYQGQFVGAVPAWGLPDFAMSTSALKVYEQGTIVIDIASVAQKHTVWRGSAAAQIDRRRTVEERAKIIDEAVARMFEKFPPKPAKK